MEEEIPLKQKVDKIFEQLEQQNLPKKKKIRIPRKAKVRKGKVKKGWVGILKIDENGNISGEKTKLQDSSYRMKSGDYHSTDGKEILYWNGKYPVIIQPTWKMNPIEVRKDEEKNETYGQKYVMARMLGDTIKVKSQGAKPLIWLIGLGVVGYIVYSIFTGGF